MGLEASTTDCTLVSDAELEEISKMCSDLPNPLPVGFLSKEAEFWVLLTRVYEKGVLKGFSFYTLERQGGTPCIIMGATSITRTSKRGSIQKQIVKEQLKRALMSFPDEDVLIGARLINFSGLDFFSGLVDLIPEPKAKPKGEDRIWGWRLAKKYGIGSKDYDRETFIVKGDECQPSVVDHESANPDKLDKSMKKLFDSLDQKRGDSLILFGWAKANYILKQAGK